MVFKRFSAEDHVTCCGASHLLCRGLGSWCAVAKPALEAGAPSGGNSRPPLSSVCRPEPAERSRAPRLLAQSQVARLAEDPDQYLVLVLVDACGGVGPAWESGLRGGTPKSPRRAP